MTRCKVCGIKLNTPGIQPKGSLKGYKQVYRCTGCKKIILLIKDVSNETKTKATVSPENKPQE